MKLAQINFYFLFVLLIAISTSCGEQKKNGSPATDEDAPISDLSEMIRSNPDDSQLYYERAIQYYKKEAYDEALDDIVLAQEIDSINPAFYHLKADIYLDYFRSFDALKTMEEVVMLHPKRIPSLLKLAEFQYILKKYNESILTLNDVLAIDQLEPEAFFMLGMNFRATGEQEKAKNAFQTAVENDPELVDAWIMLGQLFENEGNPDALVYYENALRVAPQSIEALHAKAFYYQNHDNIPKALEIYREISIIDPSYPDAYLNSGLLYLEMDSLASAHENFNIMVKTAITNPIGYFYRAYTFEQMGELKKARIDYEQALKLAPDFEEARNALEILMSKEPI